MEVNFHYGSMLRPSSTTTECPRQKLLCWHHNYFVWVVCCLFIGDMSFKKRRADMTLLQWWEGKKGDDTWGKAKYNQRLDFLNDNYIFWLHILAVEYLYFWNSSRKKNFAIETLKVIGCFLILFTPLKQLLLKVIFNNSSLFKNIFI